jgi:hypothetical protein
MSKSETETIKIHVTRLEGGAVYGHEIIHCDPVGCAGEDGYWHEINAEDLDVHDTVELAVSGPGRAMADLAINWDGTVFLEDRIAEKLNVDAKDVSIDLNTGDVWDGRSWLGDDHLAAMIDWLRGQGCC